MTNPLIKYWSHHATSYRLVLPAVDDAEAIRVEGVGEARARGIREGLSRLAETSILDRYS